MRMWKMFFKKKVKQGRRFSIMYFGISWPSEFSHSRTNCGRQKCHLLQLPRSIFQPRAYTAKKSQQSAIFYNAKLDHDLSSHVIFLGKNSRTQYSHIFVWFDLVTCERAANSQPRCLLQLYAIQEIIVRWWWMRTKINWMRGVADRCEPWTSHLTMQAEEDFQGASSHAALIKMAFNKQIILFGITKERRCYPL